VAKPIIHSINAIKNYPYLPREIYYTEADYLAAKKRIDEKRTHYDALYKVKEKENGEP